MHAHLNESDEIDNNLYPALLQVFAIILMGYLAGAFDIMKKPQMLGLNRFVGTFALPALLFRSIAILDFSSVNWLFLTSVFLSKAAVFFAALCLTLLTLRPVNIGLAAVFAIFVSQSNDFALGFPIVNAIYSQTHPDYLHYMYLIAPISLCILNPIAFLLMEANEIMYNNKRLKELEQRGRSGEHDSDDADSLFDHNDEEENDLLITATTSASASINSDSEKDLINPKLAKIKVLIRSLSHNYAFSAPYFIKILR
jgi:predicted permease